MQTNPFWSIIYTTNKDKYQNFLLDLKAVATKKTSRTSTPIAVFHVQRLRWRDLLTTFLPLTLLVIAPLGYGLWRFFYGYTNYGPVAAWHWGLLWFLTAGVLVLILLLYTLRRLLRARRMVKVFKGGLQLERPLRRPLRLRWRDIEGISAFSSQMSFLGWKSKPQPHLIIYPARQSPVKLDHRFQKLGDLTKIVKEHVYPGLYQQFKERFRQGETLNFGQVTLSQEGLSLADKDLPWSYIKGITAKDGIFIVKLSPQVLVQVPIKEIHNIEVLIQLIKREV